MAAGRQRAGSGEAGALMGWWGGCGTASPYPSSLEIKGSRLGTGAVREEAEGELRRRWGGGGLRDGGHGEKVAGEGTELRRAERGGEIQPRHRNKNRILKNFNGLHQSSFFTK